MYLRFILFCVCVFFIILKTGLFIYVYTSLLLLVLT